MYKQKNETEVPFWIGQSFFTPSCAFFMLLCEYVQTLHSLYIKPLYNTEDFVLFCTSSVVVVANGAPYQTAVVLPECSIYTLYIHTPMRLC